MGMLGGGGGRARAFVSVLTIFVGAACAPLFSGGGSTPAKHAFEDAGASGDATTFSSGDVASLCMHADCDGDGYASPADCNDNDALVSPDAYDFVGDGVDNDCDGAVDNPVESCETIPAQLPGS